MRASNIIYVFYITYTNKRVLKFFEEDYIKQAKWLRQLQYLTNYRQISKIYWNYKVSYDFMQ